MAYIIAVANQKGGVAKTTTVVSVAGSFAQAGYEVLTIDLDTQADLTLSLGLNPGKLEGSMADVLMNDAKLETIVRATSITGIDIAPATAAMENAEKYLPMRQNHTRVLHSALQDRAIQSNYDVVLIDCPPFLGVATRNAIDAANLLIIPTQPEYFSAHALRNMMSVIRQARSQSNPQLVYRILITMQDRRNRIHRNLSEQIRTTFGDGLLNTVIEIDTKLRESSIVGVPINYYKSKSRAALQYQTLSQELTNYVSKAVAQAA